MLCQDIHIMRIGAFEIQEPVPEFKDLHAIALLHPWVDAGSVGTLALERLERHLGAKEFGKLHRPGNFFDFTRYRPTSKFVEGERVVVVPNTNLYYVRQESGQDLLFVHLMEPHAYAERYIHSIVELFKTLDIKRYCRISGMYNAVPHTRPLRVTGSPELEKLPGMAGLITPRTPGGGYQGPTSIMNSVTEELEKLGTENISFMVHLPHYLSLEEDYAGTARLMEVLCNLYDFPKHLAETERGEKQYREVATEVERNAQVKSLVSQLEEYYDSQQTTQPEEETPPLSPDVERFLRDVGGRLDS